MPESPNPPAGGATVVASVGGPPGAPAPAPAQPSGVVAEGVDPAVGTILADRYRILKRLGEGGMGTVYLAEHTTINKKLALKVLSSEFAHKQDLVDRFLQEARAASMISQENVVEITDYGSTPDGSVFFVMELLQGEDLSKTIKTQGALPWARVKPIMVQICSALQAAHERGIIHRDMKPENCYRIKRGATEDFIKVLDFGIAKVTSDEAEGGKGLTRTGMIFGTPEYMSPEQARGEKPDHRVDVYAVGIILYELLVGQTPFQADTFMGILTKHMFEAPSAPTQVNPNADVPPEVEAIILKALQKDKEYRFQSMNEFREAVEAVGTGAGAVAVVHENVAMPSAGRTEFTGGRTYPPATQPPLEGEERKSKLPLVAGLVGLLAIGGIGAAMTLKSDPPPPVETAPAASETAPAPAPVVQAPVEAPAPVQKVLAADAKKVTFKITTPGIEAQILDARDEAIFGMTNSATGVLVEESEEPLNLILRAPGYEDLEFPIVPDRDKTFEKELVKKKVAKPRPGGGGKSGPDAKAPAAPEPKDAKPEKPVEKPAEPKDKPKPKVPVQIQGNQDLKDPFGRGG